MICLASSGQEQRNSVGVLSKSQQEMETTIRFGTTTGPCNTAASERAYVPEDTSNDDGDPDKLVQCPFDKNHLIRVSRFPFHLIKCKKNHPKLARELKTCPFNARHLLPKDQFKHHTETCENRPSLDTEEAGSTNGHRQWQVPVSTWVNPVVTEDWEEEAEDVVVPFIWGVSTKPKKTRGDEAYRQPRSKF